MRTAISITSALLCCTITGCATDAPPSNPVGDGGGNGTGQHDGAAGTGADAPFGTNADTGTSANGDASTGTNPDAGTGTNTDAGTSTNDAATPPVDSGPPPTVFPTLPYRGLSLAGAEFGVQTSGSFDARSLGSRANDYYYPDTMVVANAGNYPNGYAQMAYPYYRGKGMNIVRLPFRWERLQRTLNSAFDAGELAALQMCVADMINAGFVVLIDPHNYARYASSSEISSGAAGDTLGSSALPNSAFADFWRRLATLYANNTHVIFDLMNEPYGLNTNQIWPDAAQAAVTAIRSAGANNMIFIEGNEYADAKQWPAISDTLKNITDPANNIVFEAHVYPDDSGGGGSDTCSDVNSAVTQLQPFTAWLKTNHARAFLGEFSAGISVNADPRCMTAVDNELKHLEANTDVYIGWTYWAGGSGFGTDNPMEHGIVTGTDSPQMTMLLNHLK